MFHLLLLVYVMILDNIYFKNLHQGLGPNIHGLVTDIQVNVYIAGFKLGPDSREKWLLPPGKLGRSDSF